MAKFKPRQDNSKYTDIGAYDEEYVLVSFRHFNPKGSPKNIRLHQKTNEALKIICSSTWRSFMSERRSNLGGMEYIPASECSVSQPLDMKEDAYIVVDCGRKVGRLFGFKEKNVLHVVELDTFKKYNHGS